MQANAVLIHRSKVLAERGRDALMGDLLAEDREAERRVCSADGGARAPERG